MALLRSPGADMVRLTRGTVLPLVFSLSTWATAAAAGERVEGQLSLGSALTGAQLGGFPSNTALFGADLNASVAVKVLAGARGDLALVGTLGASEMSLDALLEPDQGALLEGRLSCALRWTAFPGARLRPYLDLGLGAQATAYLPPRDGLSAKASVDWIAQAAFGMKLLATPRVTVVVEPVRLTIGPPRELWFLWQGSPILELRFSVLAASTSLGFVFG